MVGVYGLTGMVGGEWSRAPAHPRPVSPCSANANEAHSHPGQMGMRIMCNGGGIPSPGCPVPAGEWGPTSHSSGHFHRIMNNK